ncbi:MAG: hypothetical protein ACOYL6_13985 [Bacteriovoracaceae bacterium]
MKKIILVSSLLLSAFSMAETKMIWAPLDHLYVPKGFDNNDSVEVVVSGYFPTPCYSRNTVNVDVKKDVVTIKVTALISDEKFKWCPEMVVPYTETVSVGNLQGGTYKILVNNESANFLSDEITIQESASNAINDHVYAAVNQIERKESSNEFVLKTVQYSDCYALDRIEYFDNGKDTVSILPIMKKVKKLCPFKGSLVEYPVKVDFANMKVDKALLHIRTIDGKSVNSIVDLGDSR